MFVSKRHKLVCLDDSKRIVLISNNIEIILKLTSKYIDIIEILTYNYIDKGGLLCIETLKKAY